MKLVPICSGGMTADQFAEWASENDIVHISWPEREPAIRFSGWCTPQRILFEALSTTNRRCSRAFNDHWYLVGRHPEHPRKGVDGVHSPHSVVPSYISDQQYIEDLQGKYDILLAEHNELKEKYVALVEDKALHPKRKLKGN